jgi:hypothetical protein
MKVVEQVSHLNDFNTKKVATGSKYKKGFEAKANDSAFTIKIEKEALTSSIVNKRVDLKVKKPFLTH